MGAQLVDDLVDRSAIGMEGDAGEVELVGGDAGDGRTVRLVMWGCEEVVCEDRQALRRSTPRAMARS
jgi:hypothetical protein